MNSPADLRTSHSLEILDALRGRLADFAQREEALTKELHAARNAATRQHREAQQALEERMAQLLKDTEDTFTAAEERARATHARRRARIQSIQHASIREVMQRAQQAKQKFQSDLQMRHFETERAFPADLKAEDTAYREFGAVLAALGQRVGAVEAQARTAFAAYPSHAKMLTEDNLAPSETGRDELFAQCDALLSQAEIELAAYRELSLPKAFRFLPIPVLLIVAAVIGVIVADRVGFGNGGLLIGGGAIAVLAAAVFILHRVGGSQGKAKASDIAATICLARGAYYACTIAASEHHEAERQRIKDDYARVCEELQEGWNRADDIELEYSRDRRGKIEHNVPRATAANEKLFRKTIPRLASERKAALESVRATADSSKKELAAGQEAAMAALNENERAKKADLQAEWRRELESILASAEAMNSAGRAAFPEWTSEYVETWEPPKKFAGSAKFARLDLDLANPGGPAPKQLAHPSGGAFSVPVSTAYPSQGSAFFEVADSGNATVTGSLNNIVLRLLSTTPPGKIAFTILDPVGLGQNFAGFMHLADYEEAVINRRIWTQRDQIDERLSELNEHIEKVIQMYLRNEFASIAEYNEQAGSVAEKLHFLVVADFPANFSESAIQKLQSIAASGPRCGVYTLIHWDSRQPMPEGISADDLRKNSVSIRGADGALALADERQGGAALVFDAPPPPELAAALVHKIGKASVDSNRVEVPFQQVAPREEEFWAQDTTSELRVAIGRTGATKLQYLSIGKGTRQHALFAGKTGSGKSTLFHVIITNLALGCSPEQVEFYLIDFKKGVEFKCYAEHRLPHARVIAIESDREFGLSVLQRVDEELKRRGDLFRKLGAQDIAGYKRAGGTEPMPRSLLMIDEFQEFFVEDDEIAQNASVLFDRIVRQGRAFGIHVLLGSQTLGGAFTLARATMGQMVIRVALQCNEADAYLIMDDTNSAPRLLSRPGEGIYNDAAGAVEGNSPFQVVWLPDGERDAWLEKVAELDAKRAVPHAGPIVFEGNAPAEIRENFPLASVLETRPESRPHAAHCWVGAPNSIKGPTEAVFHRQSGNHLLIVGQRDDAALAMLGLSLIALAAQHPLGTAKFFFLHNVAPGSADAEFLSRVASLVPHGVTMVQNHNISSSMDVIGNEMKKRSGGEPTDDAPSVFVFIHGVQRFKKLRHEDDFSFGSSDDGGQKNPDAVLNDVITDGSSAGVHLLASFDTFNNVSRFLSRKALSEIEMRIVFQMSANDSASLIDSPKASGLGLHRALLYNEQQGSLETFRPYATPDAEWLEEAAKKLAALHA